MLTKNVKVKNTTFVVACVVVGANVVVASSSQNGFPYSKS